jgi:hypothetical protein
VALNSYRNKGGHIASEIERIKCAAWEIIADPKANRIERLEALKLIAACKGLLLPDINEQWLSVRQVAQLRRIKQQLVEKVLARKERKQRVNRKQYIKRRIAELEAQKETETIGTGN